MSLMTMFSMNRNFSMNRKFLACALALFLAAPAAGQTIRFGLDENGQPVQSDRGVPGTPIAGDIVPGDSYFAYTLDESICNGDGTMEIVSRASWVQLDGDIQTSDINDAFDAGAGETVLRGPVGETSGTGGWNVLGDWPLEADDTAFATTRGRDGGTLADPLIYEVTVRYDCSGAVAGDPPVITYETFHRGGLSLQYSIPTLSAWSLILLAMLAAGLGVLVINRR